MPEPLSTANTSHSHYHSELFTVRLWHEDLGEGRVEWHGKVQHVLSGEVRYFRDWRTLVAFVQEKLPDPYRRAGETPHRDKD